MSSKILENTLIGLSSAERLDFSVFSAENRSLWDSLPETVRKEIIRTAEECRFTQEDTISLSLFQDFRKTGNRKRLEDVYFAKRRKLSCLVIAECVENDGRFISAIEEGIWSVISEPAWVIPAHNSYVRDTAQLSLPLLERPVLDLFACETAEILALSACCLKNQLDPILIEDVWSELERRIAIPYITDHFWWMGASGPLNNWTPWCTQNVLISLLSNPRLSGKERMKAVKQATFSLDLFMDSYSEDGGCDEGASYYHAAALALFGALKVLEKSTGRDFTCIYHSTKVKNMAAFIEDVFIAQDLYLNYADCSPKAGVLTAREYLFAMATENAQMAHHAACDVLHYGWQEEDNSYNLFYKLLALASYNEIVREAEKDAVFDKKRFKSFEKTQLVIWREADITFAIKGGNNAESHNHNDVGSIILYKGTKPLLVDIGVETYTKTTFSDQRYTLKPMQSSYHNVVNFPPLQQKDGAEYRAQQLSLSDSSVSFDLTGAYPKDSGLVSYVRTAFFNRDDRTITVTEDIVSSQAPVLTLMSQEEPVIRDGAIDYASFTVSFSKGFESAGFEVMNITDERLRKAWPDRLYRTLITLSGSAEWKIDFK